MRVEWVWRFSHRPRFGGCGNFAFIASVSWWISATCSAVHVSPPKWSHRTAIDALPARKRAILPRTHRGERLICGMLKRMAPCFGGGAPRRCAAIAACAPRTCSEPDGIRANRSRPPARTMSLAAPRGPMSAAREGECW